MRRTKGALIPLEVSILEAVTDLFRRGTPQSYGFMLAKELKERTGARLLTAYGTLYKALDRLEQAGYLASRWEDPAVAALESRPRRRFYRITLAGETALLSARASAPARAMPRPGTGSAFA